MKKPAKNKKPSQQLTPEQRTEAFVLKHGGTGPILTQRPLKKQE